MREQLKMGGPQDTLVCIYVGWEMENGKTWETSPRVERAREMVRGEEEGAREHAGRGQNEKSKARQGEDVGDRKAAQMRKGESSALSIQGERGQKQRRLMKQGEGRTRASSASSRCQQRRC